MLEQNLVAFGVQPTMTLTSKDALDALRDTKAALVLVNADSVTGEEIQKIRTANASARIVFLAKASDVSSVNFL